MTRRNSRRIAVAEIVLAGVFVVMGTLDAAGQNAPRVERSRKRPAEPVLSYPPRLPDGGTSVRVRSAKLLEPPESLLADEVLIAREAPTVDFVYYPGQTYPGKPWSNWGEGSATAGKYYSAIGDHLAIGVKGDDPNRTGTSFVYEYNAQTKELRRLVDVAALLDLGPGHYTPGKIHSRLEPGRDGWLYFATHRGSARAAIDENHYQGDWILRCHPRTGETEVVAHSPVPKHSIPASVLDPDRLIFYGATAAGPDAEQQGTWFFAYDVRNRKLIFAGPNGPARSMILARSSGRIYYVAGKGDGPLWRFDPRSGSGPVELGGLIGVRAATRETQQGFVYTVSLGQRQSSADLWAFNTATEEIENLGPAGVGTQSYVASLAVDETGRYLYYVPGAHGGSDRDGSPVVQFDIRNRRKKVIAFLHPYFQEQFGCTLKGTYSVAVDPEGDKVYITWNVSRGSRAWDCCALTVIHIPQSEREQ